MLSMLFVVVVSTLSVLVVQAREGDEPALNPGLNRRYGFQALINSKFNDGIAGLQSVDVDGDGRTDLVLINNGKAQIEILRQRRPDEEVEVFDPESINDLPDESYFVRESYPTEQKVTSLVVVDLNDDGRRDLAYTGDSGQLTVVFRDESGAYRDPLRFDIEKGSGSLEALRAGDLDRDGRTDLVLLGENTTYTFVQDAAGRLTEGPQFPNATTNPDGFDLVDIDGDGVLDLLYVLSDSDWPFRYRFGLDGVAYGPEMRSEFTGIRSYAASDLDGDGRAELGAVRRRSGRFTLLGFADPTDTGAGRLVLSSPRLLPFSAFEDSAGREALLADIDGDGNPDLLVAEPAAARIVVYHGDATGMFGDAQVFPSFVGASKPRLADVTGNGHVDLVVAAPAESAVGIASIEDGQLSFPVALGYPGEDLLALDTADQDGDGTSEIWTVVGTGRSRSRKHTLARLDPAADEGAEPQTWELEDLEADPNDMLLVDLDRDGRRDVILFIPTKLPAILLATDDGWEDVAVKDVPGLGIMKGIGREAVAVGDVDGDGQSELLVPGPNFARAFTLADGTARVVGQYNLPNPSAQVVAVAVGDMDGRGAPEILLVERSLGQLHVLRQADGGADEIGRAKLGDFMPAGLVVADVDADGGMDVVLTGRDQFGVIRAGQADPGYTADLEFESPVRDANLDRIAFGDVNSDGIEDIVLTETSKHLISIEALEDKAIVHALKFPVFEQRIFGQGRGAREPRELIVADVTGDGLLDIAIVVHDRVIVYPQE